MELLTSLWNVVVALAALVVALGQFILPWTPLIAWVAFWLLAVNWRELYPILMRGGAIGVGLIGLTTVLVWATVSPPVDGVHHLLGLEVSNHYGKVVYVSSLIVIAFLCGSVQVSGCCDSICCVGEPEPNSAEQH